MTRRGLSLALGLALLSSGCAGLISGKEPAETADAPAPRTADGAVQVEKGRAGLVIAAPHGTSDAATDVIGRDLARLTGFGAVVVTGYSNVDGDGRRYNVNRPTEGVPGAAARLEAPTGPARRVYDAYRRRVAEAAQGPLRLYVEVHGNAREESAGRLEIATVGVSRDDAWRLKTLLELIRDARLPADGDAPRLDVWMEPLDPVWYTAAAAKQSGLMAETRLAMHIEMPRAARTTYREVYTAVLADFLIQSVALLLPAAR
jgi:hypothetical protein